MATSPSSPLDPFPDELVAAVAFEARRDANGVASLLEALGFVPTPQSPIRLDADFLLELAAAMRLLDWERNGIHTHLAAGLPTASEIIIQAFRNLAESGMIPHGGEIPRRVMGLFVDRFAWHGRRELDATV